jgi:hypothetical protein
MLLKVLMNSKDINMDRHNCNPVERLQNSSVRMHALNTRTSKRIWMKFDGEEFCWKWSMQFDCNWNRTEIIVTVHGKIGEFLCELLLSPAEYWLEWGKKIDQIIMKSEARISWPVHFILSCWTAILRLSLLVSSLFLSFSPPSFVLRLYLFNLSLFILWTKGNSTHITKIF